MQIAMFCPKCGSENPDDATYCKSCGASLQTQTFGAPGQMPNAGTPMSNPSSKSPIVAAILNLFWGIGYWYLGYKKVLGIATVLFIILMLIVYFILGFFTAGIITLIIAVVLAIDGYQKGQGQKGFISAEM